MRAPCRTINSHIAPSLEHASAQAGAPQTWMPRAHAGQAHVTGSARAACSVSSFAFPVRAAAPCPCACVRGARACRWDGSACAAPCTQCMQNSGGQASTLLVVPHAIAQAQPAHFRGRACAFVPARAVVGAQSLVTRSPPRRPHTGNKCQCHHRVLATRSECFLHESHANAARAALVCAAAARAASACAWGTRIRQQGRARRVAHTL